MVHPEKDGLGIEEKKTEENGHRDDHHRTENNQGGTQDLCLLLSAIGPVLSDENIPLEEKIRSITQNYTSLLLENEELPIFLLNELSINKEPFADLVEKEFKQMIRNPLIPNLIIMCPVMIRALAVRQLLRSAV